MRNFFLCLTASLPLMLFLSCQTTGAAKSAEPSKTSKASGSQITMLFAGDIMAHSTNYKPGNFDNIWKYVTPLVKSADLSFANIEAPVANDLEWSNYPRFNMHTSYVEAAIDAGFNVFSLSNNHTNDQKLHGIKATKKYFDGREGIWSSGLRDTPNSGLDYKIIETTGEDGSNWRILFTAISEVTNWPDDLAYVNYYPAIGKKRAELKEALKKASSENPHDLFVLSIHTDEPEYVTKVTSSHKKFFRELISECGVDIIWGNHPHVTKEWEILRAGCVETGLEDYAERKKDSLIMYANGNTISGQRYKPSFTNPDNVDDNTGDGVMIKVTVKKSGARNAQKDLEISTEPFFITTYITPSKQFVVRLLDDDFISSLEHAEVTNWSGYLKARKEINEAILEKSKF